MRVIMGVPNWWGSFTQVHSHHFARLFRRIVKASILYISHPLCLLHILGIKREWRGRMKLWWRGPHKVDNGIHAYVPLSLLARPRRSSLLDGEWLGENWLRWTVPSLRKVLKRSGFERPEVLMVSDPLMTKLADLTEAVIRVYYVADDHTDHPKFPRWASKWEEEYARNCQVVAYPTVSLKKRAEEIAPQAVICFTPHGVDYEHFARPRPRPPEYTSIPRPRAVYVGLIEMWVDLELVAYCARSLPRFSFVLIGPIRVPTNVVRNLPNVYLLGPRPYEEIPAYLQHADVGLVPFRLSRLTAAVRPVKLYEYMAAGLPVVATRNPAIEAENPPIFMADTYEEFAQALERALEERNAEVLREFVKGRSWERSFMNLLNAIKQVLDKSG